MTFPFSTPATSRQPAANLTAGLALCFYLVGAAASAQQAMTGAEFDAYSRGKTFYFAEGGTPYGAEEYLDNRRVRWSFLDGECKDGEWYEDGKMICFVYEDRPDPQCWTFVQSAAGLIATFQNDPTLTELYEVQKSPEPLLCLGPKVGV